MSAPIAAAVALAAMPFLLAGCDDGEAQFAPSLPTVAGFKGDGDALEVWTGPPCEEVTRVVLLFGKSGSPTVRSVADSDDTVTIERLTVGGPPPGFTVAESLPSDFDWRDYDWAQVDLETADGPRPARTELKPVLEGSEQHASDNKYYFDGQGWLDESGVDEGNTKDFLAVCTPDPAKK